MSTIAWGLPCLQKPQEEQTKLSKSLRISAVLLGSAVTIAGAIIILQMPGVWGMGCGYSTVSLGIVLVLLGIAIKAVKLNLPTVSAIDPSQQALIKKWWQDYRPEEELLATYNDQAFEENDAMATQIQFSLSDDFSLEKNIDIILNDPKIKYLIIGESHNENASKKFLKDYGFKFAKSGFEIIGSEFHKEDRQKNLDDYHWKLFADMPEFPTTVFEGASRAPVLEYFSDELGIRTVGLESPISSKQSGSSSMRLTCFDPQAANVIHHETTIRSKQNVPLSRNPNGKQRALIWVGGAHTFDIATYLGPQNCAILHIRDKKTPQAQFKIGDQYREQNKTGKKPRSKNRTIDLLIEY